MILLRAFRVGRELAQAELRRGTKRRRVGLDEDSLARDRNIGMIQPKAQGDRPALFDIGCLARIQDVEALEDGRYNIILEGLQRFAILRELDVTTEFRQVEVELWEEDEAGDALSIADITVACVLMQVSLVAETPLDQWPSLAAHFAAMQNLPAIAEPYAAAETIIRKALPTRFDLT